MPSAGYRLVDSSQGPSLAQYTLAFVRRRRWLCLSLAALAILFLSSTRHPSHPLHERLHHPHDGDDLGAFALPGTLTYNKTNPFETTWQPAHGAPGGGGGRLMEKLVLKYRGGEEVIREAAARAEAKREGGQRQLHRRRVPGDDTSFVDDRDEEKGETAKEEDFEWLRGRTVVLLGDSIDRYHLLHLCQFLAPDSPLVPLDSHHSRPEDYISTYEPHKTPEVYSAALLVREKELADKFRDGHPYGSVLSRPWACKIDPEGLNAWLIWQFWNGLDDGQTTPGLETYEVDEHGVEQVVLSPEGLVGLEGTYVAKARAMPWGDRAFYPVESEHFNPPLSPEDRLKDVMLPLLETLGRGSPDKVDMVEVGIGAWDLGMFRTQDQLAIKRDTPRNVSATEAEHNDVLKKLGKARSESLISAPRLTWFDNRLSAVLRRLEDVFPTRARSSSSSPPPRVRVRTMPVPPQWYSYPWVMSKTRILQLEGVVRDVVGRVVTSPATVRAALLGGGGMVGDGLGDRSSRREGGGGARHPHGGSQENTALNRASIAPPPPPPPRGEEVPPAGVAFSNWAEMIRSADQFLDHIHPGPIPGSWLWADMMLHELRAIVTA